MDNEKKTARDCGGLGEKPKICQSLDSKGWRSLVAVQSPHSSCGYVANLQTFFDFSTFLSQNTTNMLFYFSLAATAALLVMRECQG